jgi:hypothetical protein
VTLAASLVLAQSSIALAGSPATFDENASAPKPRSAVADTTRKSNAKSAPVTAAKRSTVAAQKTQTTVASSSGSAKVAAKPVAKAPAVAAKPAATPQVAKAVPASIPRVAPPPSNPTVAAKTTSVSVAKAGNPVLAPSASKAARIPAPAAPGMQAKAVALTPRVAPLAPTKTPPGPTLAQQGRTTVTAPAAKPTTSAVTRLQPSGPAKAGAVMGAGVASRMVPGAKGVASTAAKPGFAPGAALEDHVTYQYNALGRRDPFQSLMEGEYVGADVGGQAPPDLGGLKVVGVVWGSTDQFAMVEDARGDSYVLRRGDHVMNGYVEGLKRDALIVNITVDGQSQSVTIPITRKGDKSNGNR